MSRSAPSVTRRNVLAAAGGAFLGGPLLGFLRGRRLAAEPAPPAEKPSWASIGEPYALAGKRLVFTNWYYIRPGSFGWYNDAGKYVSMGGSEGPFGAHFRRSDGPHGLRLVAQPAARVGPVLKHEKPWEGKGVALGTVIQDGDRYRAWGGCQSEKGESRACYFESRDGVTWERPSLGLVEIEGSRDNNLLPVKPGTVFIDPSAPPAERYKGVDLGEITHEEFKAFKQRRPDAWEPRADRPYESGNVFAVRGAVSPDGLHWTLLPDPLVCENSDTQIVASWDPQLKKYVMFTRQFMVGPRAEAAAGIPPRGTWWGGDRDGPGRRAIGRSESADFRNFPVSELLLEPGPEHAPDDLFYTNAHTTIPGAPDHHLLFPAIWHTSEDSTDIDLAAGHDTRHWHFLPGSPVLRTAPFGEWDGGCVFAGPNLIERPDGAFALPYTGFIFPHKYPRGQWRYLPGFAVWPHGRLVALEAADRGEFATVAILAPGPKALLNARTQRAGSVLVEAAGPDGKPLEGRSFADAVPIVGDQPAAPVRWKEREDLGAKEGVGLILRFRMEKASIFGLEFIT